MTGIEPGWYRDPVDPEIQRYWDGEAYVGDPIPADATPPSGPPVSIEPARFETAEPDPEPEADQDDGVAAFSTAGTVPATHPTALPLAGAAGGRPPFVGTPPPTSWPAYPRLVLPRPRPHGFPLAGIGARFIARLIDTLVLLGLNILVNGWFVYKLAKVYAPYISAVTANGNAAGVEPPEQASTLLVVILFVGAALWFAYEVPQLANTGQTLGKRLTGIKVMALDNDAPLGFRRAIRRWNTLGLPTLFWFLCGMGFILQALDVLWLLFDRPLHQALHDKAALTVVVTVGVGATSTDLARTEPSTHPKDRET